MTIRIHRVEIPVNDQTHTITMPTPCHAEPRVGCRDIDSVDLWYIVDDNHPLKEQRTFRVVGTGHDWPDDGDWVWRGTAIAPDGFHVWHLIERLYP